MSELVIPAAAALLGYGVYGGTGAAIGWSIGSYLTRTDTSNIEMPTVGDLRVQTSQAGVAIPIIAGKQRVAGNIFWSTDKAANQVSQRSGGKGGFTSGPDTVITTYSISMAISICRGPILGIARCWMDGTLVAGAGTGQTKLPGTLYLGNHTQNADPTMSSIEGTVPDYRGLAYIVLTDFDLGATGRIPHFSFEVVKENGIEGV